MASEAELLLSSRMVRIFLLRLRAKGGDVASFVRRYSIRDDWDSAEDVPMLLPVFRQFSDEVAEAVGDPDFGLTSARGTPRGAYGIFEYAARNDPTLGEATRSVVRYSAAFNGVVRYSFDLLRGEAIFDLHVPGEPLCMGRHGNEFAVMVFLKTAREVVTDPLIPRRVWFAHPAPASIASHEKALGVKPEFGSGHSGLALDAALAELPLVSPDPALRQILERQAQSALSSLAPAHDFVAKVRELVAAALPKGGAATERIAAVMHMSGRTLQRRLKDHRTSFEDVVDEVRKAQAMSLLHDEKLSLGEVAFLLGYADQATFSRAFKRWTGKAPGEYRRG